MRSPRKSILEINSDLAPNSCFLYTVVVHVPAEAGGRSTVSIQFNLILFPMEFQFTNILMLREEDGMAKRGQRGPGTVLPPIEKLPIVGANRNC